jgi:hypothetical protein
VSPEDRAAELARDWAERALGPKIHYAGALSWRQGKTKTSVLAGWAACCSGDRAEKIRAAGTHTYEASAVTCKRCLTCLDKAAISALVREAEGK